jgi:4-alpha-glucanotransferase
MNIPGTIADNWQWKMVSGQMDDCLAQDMAAMNALFGRGLAQ